MENNDEEQQGPDVNEIYKYNKDYEIDKYNKDVANILEEYVYRAKHYDKFKYTLMKLYNKFSRCYCCQTPFGIMDEEFDLSMRTMNKMPEPNGKYYDLNKFFHYGCEDCHYKYSESDSDSDSD